MGLVELRNSRISLSLKALGEIPKLKQISPKRGRSTSGTNGQGNRSLVAPGSQLTKISEPKPGKNTANAAKYIIETLPGVKIYQVI